MSLSRNPSRRVWGAPIGIGVTTTIGLVSALFGSGAWDALSWTCLAVPLWAGLRYWAR